MTPVQYTFLFILIFFCIVLIFALIGAIWRINTLTEDYFDAIEDLNDVVDEYEYLRKEICSHCRDRIPQHADM